MPRNRRRWGPRRRCEAQPAPSRSSRPSPSASVGPGRSGTHQPPYRRRAGHQRADRGIARAKRVGQARPAVARWPGYLDGRTRARGLPSPVAWVGRQRIARLPSFSAATDQTHPAPPRSFSAHVRCQRGCARPREAPRVKRGTQAGDQRQRGTPMAYAISRNQVADYDTFRKAYDSPEGVALRQRMGIKSQHIFRNPADPNDVVILTEVERLEEAPQAKDSPALREAMRLGG